MSTPVLRLVREDDAAELAALLTANREFLAPWEPLREASWFTAAGQLTALTESLLMHARGISYPMVIELDDRIVGRANLNSIVRGAGQYASVGYWVAESVTGRGIATAAVAELRRTAFAGLNLHRLEAGTLPHNVASQRVLERNGFTRYGLAPQYVRIAGRWQDHLLYQLLNPDWSPGPAEAYAG